MHSSRDFAETIKEVIPEIQIKFATVDPEREKGEAARKYPPMPIDRIKEGVSFTLDYDLKRGVLAYPDWLRDGKYN
ncbi:hypothetical protein ACFLUU_01565 [Chloroflexota bacterium]